MNTILLLLKWGVIIPGALAIVHRGIGTPHPTLEDIAFYCGFGLVAVSIDRWIRHGN